MGRKGGGKSNGFIFLFFFLLFFFSFFIGWREAGPKTDLVKLFVVGRRQHPVQQGVQVQTDPVLLDLVVVVDDVRPLRVGHASLGQLVVPHLPLVEDFGILRYDLRVPARLDPTFSPRGRRTNWSDDRFGLSGVLLAGVRITEIWGKVFQPAATKFLRVKI